MDISKINLKKSLKTKIDYDKLRFNKNLEKLSLSDQEIRTYAYFLDKKITIDEGCLKDDSFCKTNAYFHIDFERNMEKKLFVYASTCPHHQQGFDYNSYENTPISKTKFNNKYFSNNTDKSFSELTNIFKEKFLNPEIWTGIYGHGDFGIGKTYFFFAIANKYLKRNKSVTFVNLSDVQARIKAGFNDSYKKMQSEIIVESLFSSDILFIDDIGSENIAEWFFNETLLNVLNSRLSQNQTTYFNSNYSLNELEKVMFLKYKTSDKISIKRVMDRIRALVGNKDFKLKGKNMRY